MNELYTIEGPSLEGFSRITLLVQDIGNTHHHIVTVLVLCFWGLRTDVNHIPAEVFLAQREWCAVGRAAP
jgi:hypothetical protein